jgi:hypothetical protein
MLRAAMENIEEVSVRQHEEARLSLNIFSAGLRLIARLVKADTSQRDGTVRRRGPPVY